MKISVIVPVYNAEKYLKKCIESVITQTYSDWELLLVDDGSKDASWNIIERYSQSDKRIKGIQQTNAGPGKARNVGIENASGDYVVFLDADDYISGNYFSLLSKYNDSDLIFIDVLQVDENGNKIKEERMSVYQDYDVDKIIRSMMVGKIPWGGVRKVIRRSLLEQHNIKYMDTKIGEEALFSFSAMISAKKIGFLSEEPVYMYVVGHASQSSLLIDDPWGPAIEGYKNYLIETDRYTEYANTLNAFIFTAAVVSIDRMTRIYTGKELYEKVRSRILLCNEQYDCNYGIDKSNMMFKARIFIHCIKMEMGFPIIWASYVKNILH